MLVKSQDVNFLSRLLHVRDPHLGVMNGDVQSDLATPVFNNGENLNVFIAELSDFNRKLSSLDKLYLLQHLSPST